MIHPGFLKKLHLDLDAIAINECIAIEASTGIGKTFALMEYFSTPRSKKFSKTLFILPTRIACNQWRAYRSTIDILPAARALDCVIKTQHFNYDTVIIDEAHIDSKEYYSIFLMLHYLRHHEHRPITVLMASATIPLNYFESFYPDFRILNYQEYHIYKTTISYLEHDMMINYVNKFYILDLMYKKILETNPRFHKILCFLSTYKDCEEILERIRSQVMDKEIVIYHGGLQDYQKNQIYKKMMHQNDLIILSTNVAESSITIPDIDLVIDSCIECKMSYNSFLTVYTSKHSMIQRAGRVGRTKDGHVIRLISEANYNNDISTNLFNDHNLGFIVIKCFLSDLCPMMLFGPKIEMDVGYLQSLGIQYGTSKELLRFIDTSGLQPFSAILAHRLLAQRLSFSHKLFILFCIIIIDFYDKKPPKWFYFDLCSSYSVKRKILLTISKRYNLDNDLLITHSRILLSIMHKKEWKKYANEMHFNNKTLRDFFNLLHRILTRLFGREFDLKKYLALQILNEVVEIPEDLIEITRIFFWNNNISLTENVQEYSYFNYEHYYKPGYFAFPFRYIMNPFFTQKDTMIPSIWINCPSYILDCQDELKEHLRIRSILLDIYEKAHEGKRLVLEQIANEVGYRPENNGIMRDFTEFEEFLDNFTPDHLVAFRI